MGGLASKRTYDVGKSAKDPANEEGPIKPADNDQKANGDVAETAENGNKVEAVNGNGTNGVHHDTAKKAKSPLKLKLPKGLSRGKKHPKAAPTTNGDDKVIEQNAAEAAENQEAKNEPAQEETANKEESPKEEQSEDVKEEATTSAPAEESKPTEESTPVEAKPAEDAAQETANEEADVKETPAAEETPKEEPAGESSKDEVTSPKKGGRLRKLLTGITLLKRRTSKKSKKEPTEAKVEEEAPQQTDDAETAVEETKPEEPAAEETKPEETAAEEGQKEEVPAAAVTEVTDGGAVAETDAPKEETPTTSADPTTKEEAEPKEEKSEEAPKSPGFIGSIKNMILRRKSSKKTKDEKPEIEAAATEEPEAAKDEDDKPTTEEAAQEEHQEPEADAPAEEPKTEQTVDVTDAVVAAAVATDIQDANTEETVAEPQQAEEEVKPEAQEEVADAQQTPVEAEAPAETVPATEEPAVESEETPAEPEIPAAVVIQETEPEQTPEEPEVPETTPEAEPEQTVAEPEPPTTESEQTPEEPEQTPAEPEVLVVEATPEPEQTPEEPEQVSTEPEEPVVEEPEQTPEEPEAPVAVTPEEPVESVAETPQEPETEQTPTEPVAEPAQELETPDEPEAPVAESSQEPEQTPDEPEAPVAEETPQEPEQTPTEPEEPVNETPQEPEQTPDEPEVLIVETEAEQPPTEPEPEQTPVEPTPVMEPEQTPEAEPEQVPAETAAPENEVEEPEHTSNVEATDEPEQAAAEQTETVEEVAVVQSEEVAVVQSEEVEEPEQAPEPSDPAQSDEAPPSETAPEQSEAATSDPVIEQTSETSQEETNKEFSNETTEASGFLLDSLSENILNGENVVLKGGVEHKMDKNDNQNEVLDESGVIDENSRENMDMGAFSSKDKQLPPKIRSISFEDDQHGDVNLTDDSVTELHTEAVSPLTETNEEEMVSFSFSNDLLFESKVLSPNLSEVDQQEDKNAYYCTEGKAQRDEEFSQIECYSNEYDKEKVCETCPVQQTVQFQQKMMYTVLPSNDLTSKLTVLGKKQNEGLNFSESPDNSGVAHDLFEKRESDENLAHISNLHEQLEISTNLKDHNQQLLFLSCEVMNGLIGGTDAAPTEVRTESSVDTDQLNASAVFLKDDPESPTMENECLEMDHSRHLLSSDGSIASNPILETPVNSQPANDSFATEDSARVVKQSRTIAPSSEVDAVLLSNDEDMNDNNSSNEALVGQVAQLAEGFTEALHLESDDKHCEANFCYSNEFGSPVDPPELSEACIKSARCQSAACNKDVQSDLYQQSSKSEDSDQETSKPDNTGHDTSRPEDQDQETSTSEDADNDTFKPEDLDQETSTSEDTDHVTTKSEVSDVEAFTPEDTNQDYICSPSPTIEITPQESEIDAHYEPSTQSLKKEAIHFYLTPLVQQAGVEKVSVTSASPKKMQNFEAEPSKILDENKFYDSDGDAPRRAPSAIDERSIMLPLPDFQVPLNTTTMYLEVPHCNPEEFY